MDCELSELTLQNIPDAIDVWNQSSAGTSLATPLDIAGFLWLSRKWNFSYSHSLISYVDRQPAALILTSTDASAKDAYLYYWGTVQKFRRFRYSLQVFESCCRKLSEDGFTTLYGTSLPERNVCRYRFIGASVEHPLLDLQAPSIRLNPPRAPLAVQRINIDDLFVHIATLPGGLQCWSQRAEFLRNAAPFFDFAAVTDDHVVRAYVVIEREDSRTTIRDLRSATSDLVAGEALLDWVAEHYAGPFAASDVVPCSYSHALLTAAGFHETRKCFLLLRDLRAKAAPCAA